MVAVLGAGFVTVEVQFHNFVATLAAGILVILSAIFTILITINHRKLERRKFIHIMNCEEWLGLHRDDLIPLNRKDEFFKNKDRMIRDSAVAVPKKFEILPVLNPNFQNTSSFIIRMIIAIIIFVVLFIIFSWTG